MARLFGTDGIRGVANRDLTPDLVVAVGRAAGAVLGGGGEVVVGRDTRVSGPMLEGALAAGLCSAGTDVARAGVLPTPAVAWLTVAERARAGAVISASHNPGPDNGIKFFSETGVKLASDLEDDIEAALGRDLALPRGEGAGTIRDLEEATGRYVDHVAGTISEPLKGLTVVLDCAHGAAFKAAPLAFTKAGAEVVAIHDTPDGTRINVDCGSTSLNDLRRAVVERGADLGLAFDGDADRVLGVDEAGRPIDGDRIVGLAALRMLDSGEFDNKLVVVTVMSNLGFRRALEEAGIEVVAAPVGDRFVAEAMAESGAVLGGEQSGHVIFAAHGTTGDGIVTGLQVAAAVASSGTPLSRLAHFFEPFPQVLINVEVDAKERLESSEGLWEEVRSAEATLGEEGRVLVRASGTEPVVRVMVEAADGPTAEATAKALADAVRRHLI
ncbi:MAG: phosphoglucosamine mutase [Actinomycetota bacterium]|nr:phosphoglucosamine mutase [Actinomycetota bacterium]